MTDTIQIQTSVDIEYEIQKILAAYMTVYCRPLPAGFTMPCILVTKVGGSDRDTIDNTEIARQSCRTRIPGHCPAQQGGRDPAEGIQRKHDTCQAYSSHIIRQLGC